jgi:hypothetical protein
MSCKEVFEKFMNCGGFLVCKPKKCYYAQSLKGLYEETCKIENPTEDDKKNFKLVQQHAYHNFECNMYQGDSDDDFLYINKSLRPIKMLEDYKQSGMYFVEAYPRRDF